MIPRRSAEFSDSVGVCTHFGWIGTTYTTQYPALRSALEYARIKHVRDGAGHGLPKLADLYTTLGIKACVLVDNAAAPNYGTRRLPPSVATEGVGKVLAALPTGAVAYIEGPNEYDAVSNWVPELRAFQTTLYDAVDGRVPVLGPSCYRNTNFVLLDDLSLACDRANVHAYSGDKPHGSIIDRDVGLARVVNPARPLVVSEYGWNTTMDVWQTHPLTDKARARYLPRAMASNFVRPEIERAYIYQLADHATGTTDQFSFGLLRADASRTLAYWAVCNTMRLLYSADTNFTPTPLAARLTGDLRGVRNCLLQKASGIYDLLLWQEFQSYKQPTATAPYQDIPCPPRPVTLVLETSVSWVQVFYPSALDGNVHTARSPRVMYTPTGSLALEVPDELMIVRIAP